ncbi:MAG: hypothetical protein MJ228_00435 [Bacilli bacterium]|nr:hypothetical protein [Bacilli bacterium]
MKRTIASIASFVLLSAILISLTVPNDNKKQRAYSLAEDVDKSEIISVPEGYCSISSLSAFDRVYLDSITQTVNVLATTNIEKCQIYYPNSAYRGGDIISSGFTYGGVTYDSRIRVNKYADSIIYGDLLDTTTVECSIYDAPLPIDVSTILLKASITLNEIPSTVLSKDYSNGLIALKASLENKGDIFSNQMVAVELQYKTVSFDGVFVKKEAVFEDQAGTYIKQVVYYMKNEYYKKNYIKIIKSIPGYFGIQSDTNLVGKFVCY